MDKQALTQLREASRLYRRALQNHHSDDAFVLMCEAAVEYRAVIRLLDIDPDRPEED